MNNNHHYPLFSIKILGIFLLGILLTFNACETEVLNTCSTNITNTDVSDTNFDAGTTLTGEVSFKETIGLDNLQLQSMVQWYLSNDQNFGGDTQLVAFLDNSQTNRTGDNVRLTFDQIDIPVNQASGNYFLIVHLNGQPCGGGEVSDDDTEVIAVTIN
ncbi:MAG: hypothetical protein R3E32_29490 [Chitinophagales bacterium]